VVRTHPLLQQTQGTLQVFVEREIGFVGFELGLDDFVLTALLAGHLALGLLGIFAADL
jgi:hypothetical protein